jgi:restriction endonuclease S subunit
LGKIEIKIPKEWSVETLESNVRLLSGGTPYKENGENWIGHIPWVSPKDMSVDVVFESLDHISENAMRQLCEAKENDLLLVVRSGVLAHKVPIAIVSKTLAFNQDIKALRIINPKKLNSRYLYYFMKSLEHDLLSRGVKRGTTVHSLNTDYIENILIPIPERTEQENISNILTTIDTSINFQISEVNKLIRIKTGLMENLLTGVTQVNHLVN